ncbi:uncharacterized protein BXZ73DRAFT_102253 [Epithele typhae]|uniref:uncharacterized protein n=1 Tax=Epithele typhae TaxID=378194 RepID=UPI0020083F19|nr:uncharacterized protein BXZ73DRAFT_102253 [Epithele typhae]KAH9929099.1 hypothetical protein BXZ73DRAFT_102253 [Epithele typhae]
MGKRVAAHKHIVPRVAPVVDKASAPPLALPTSLPRPPTMTVALAPPPPTSAAAATKTIARAPRAHAQRTSSLTLSPSRVPVPVRTPSTPPRKSPLRASASLDDLLPSPTTTPPRRAHDVMLEEALERTETTYLAWEVAERAVDASDGKRSLEKILADIMERFLVALGVELLEAAEGLHFSFVDPRNSGDVDKMVAQALRLSKLFAGRGYGVDRVVITVPATDAGLEASTVLARVHGVRTSLCFASGPAHAARCASAGASFVVFSYRLLSEAYVRRWDWMRSRWAPTEPPVAHSVEEAIAASADLFRAHRVAAKIVLADLCDVPELSAAQRLQAVDAVVLDLNPAGGSSRAKPMPGVPKAMDEGAAAAGAGPSTARSSLPGPPGRQARTPAAGGFSPAMSAAERSVAGATLQAGLVAAAGHMQRAESALREYLLVKAEIAHMDPDDGLAAEYLEDVSTQSEICRLQQEGYEFERFPPCRSGHIGFRVACSRWDDPEWW